MCKGSWTCSAYYSPTYKMTNFFWQSFLINIYSLNNMLMLCVILWSHQLLIITDGWDFTGLDPNWDSSICNTGHVNLVIKLRGIWTFLLDIPIEPHSEANDMRKTCWTAAPTIWHLVTKFNRVFFSHLAKVNTPSG